jgi:N-acyl amino acid synthase FeeM
MACHDRDVNAKSFVGDFTNGVPEATFPMLQYLSREPSQLGDVKEIVFERNDFHVRMASTSGQRSASEMLVSRMYAWRGYQFASDAIPRSANEMILQACRDNATIGTLTLRLDSECGLLADALYEEEIDVYRRQGGSVCELTGLAVASRCGSKEVLASMFHLAYIFGRRRHGVTDLVIEVNPRHVTYYQRILGFRQAGPERTCERVGAPAVLLHLDLDYVDEQIEVLAGHRGDVRRSLYPYFFSRVEEEGLNRRIWAACQ